METTVKVSVLCAAYNHEAYIRKALQGFVMQKTDFPVEVIVNDDCSADGTAAIIREFEEAYATLIRPMYQQENQYRKLGRILRPVLLPQARGKYLAFCEGDDHWTDPGKLQLQADFLDKHPDYTACVHRAVYHNVGTGEDTLVPAMTEDRDFSLEEIVNQGGGIFATNSLMIRREIYEQMPDCFRANGFSDYQMFMYAAICGKVRCLAQPMSVYNMGVPGSWTERIWLDKKAREKHYRDCAALLMRIDEYCSGEHRDVFQNKILEIEYRIAQLLDDKKTMAKPQYRAFYRYDRTMAMKGKLLKAFPFLGRIKHYLKRGT